MFMRSLGALQAGDAGLGCNVRWIENLRAPKLMYGRASVGKIRCSQRDRSFLFESRLRALAAWRPRVARVHLERGLSGARGRKRRGMIIGM